MKCKKKFPEWMNEKQAARYIGKSQEFLRSRRMAESARYETKGPFYWDDIENSVRYRTEDLNDWLRLYQPSTKAATKKYRDACRSSRKGTHVREKTFGELLIDLERWMGKKRPKYLKELNLPNMSDELGSFEELTGLELPEDYKLLLSWRNGHDSEGEDIFDPFAQMGFLPPWYAQMLSTCLDELEGASCPENSTYSRYWLPFMGNRVGSELLIDLSPENHGKVYYWCGEKECGFYRYENLREWLGELVSKLQFLDVDVLEREIRAQEEYYELNGYPEPL
jgi:hypothetical protein